MTIKYETYKNSLGQDYVRATLEDGQELCIPCDPTNADYQEYLNPVKEAPAVTIKPVTE